MKEVDVERKRLHDGFLALEWNGEHGTGTKVNVIAGLPTS